MYTVYSYQYTTVVLQQVYRCHIYLCIVIFLDIKIYFPLNTRSQLDSCGYFYHGTYFFFK
jgi:hypothetical protein